MTYTAESGHYYQRDGKPAYEQVIKSGPRKGQMRNTTVADARKLGLLPSVTTIVDILDKPALTAWMCRQAVERATNPNFQEDTSAEEGSRVHGIVERYIEDDAIPEAVSDRKYVNVIEDVFAELGIYHPCSEKSFAAEDYAGACDLHDKDARIIVDYKTKDMSRGVDGKLYDKNGREIKKLTYDTHAMQLAAYRKGLGLEGAKCYNLFLSRTHPDVYELCPWDEGELERGWDMFYHCKEVWKLMKRYDPNAV